MTVKEITNEEWELISMLRNYRKAYPNGNRMILAEINEMIDVLTDIEYVEENDNTN